MRSGDKCVLTDDFESEFEIYIPGERVSDPDIIEPFRIKLYAGANVFYVGANPAKKDMSVVCTTADGMPTDIAVNVMKTLKGIVSVPTVILQVVETAPDIPDIPVDVDGISLREAFEQENMECPFELLDEVCDFETIDRLLKSGDIGIKARSKLNQLTRKLGIELKPPDIDSGADPERESEGNVWNA